jgi:ATP-dependent Zn protease
VQRIQLTTSGGHILRSNVDQAYTLPEMEREMAVLLAGRAAELLVLGEASCGAGGPFDSDLGKATRLATRIETRFGLGADGPIWMPEDHDLPASPEITQCVKHRLAKAAELAETTLRAHFDDLRRLSRAVCENGVIHGDDLLAMLTPAKTSLPPPNTPTTTTD